MNLDSSYPELTTLKAVYNGLARRIKVTYDMDWPDFEYKVCTLFSISPPLAASYRDSMGVSVIVDNNDDFWYFLVEEYTGRLDVVINNEGSAPSEWTVVRANPEVVLGAHRPSGPRIDSNYYGKLKLNDNVLDNESTSRYSTSGRASTIAETIPSIPTESPYISPTPSIPDLSEQTPEETREHFESEPHHTNIIPESPVVAPTQVIHEFPQEAEFLGHYEDESYCSTDEPVDEALPIHSEEPSAPQKTNLMSESFQRDLTKSEVVHEKKEENELKDGCSSKPHMDQSNILQVPNEIAPEVPQEQDMSLGILKLGTDSIHSNLSDKTGESVQLMIGEMSVFQESENFDSDLLLYEAAHEKADNAYIIPEIITSCEKNSFRVTEKDPYVAASEADTPSVLLVSEVLEESRQNNSLSIMSENFQNNHLISGDIISNMTVKVEAEAEQTDEVNRLRKSKELRTLCFKFNDIFYQHPALLVTLELFTDQILNGVPIDFEILENGLRRLVPTSSKTNLTGVSTDSIARDPLKSSSFIQSESHIQVNKIFDEVQIQQAPSNDRHRRFCHHRCVGRKKHRSHAVDGACESRAISKELPESSQLDQCRNPDLRVPKLVKTNSVTFAHSNPIPSPDSVENNIAENIIVRMPLSTHTVPSVEKAKSVDYILIAKLKLMRDMGFGDDGLNLEALEANSGSVPDAIEALLSS